MSACSQCGTVANATDRFCNVCGTPIARPSAAAPAAYPKAAPSQQAPAYPQAQALAATAMAPTRCPMGHEIPPGAIYCAHGHAISLDPAQLAGDARGAQPAAYGAPAAPAYGAPQPPQPAYGAPPPQAYPVPPPQPVYVPQPPQPAYQPPPQAYAPAQPQAYAPAAQGYPQPAPRPAYAPSPAPYVPPGYGAEPPAREPSTAPPAKVLRGFLVAYAPNPGGDFWPLTGGRHVVGRLGPGDGVDITLQDPTISSRHGVITVDAASGAITMEDTGSTNGTFVNDEHIGFNGRRELRDGDRLRLGGLTAIVKVIGRI